MVRAGKMVQWARALATQADLSSTPRYTQMPIPESCPLTSTQVCVTTAKPLKKGISGQVKRLGGKAAH